MHRSDCSPLAEPTQEHYGGMTTFPALLCSKLVLPRIYHSLESCPSSIDLVPHRAPVIHFNLYVLLNIVRNHSFMFLQSLPSCNDNNGLFREYFHWCLCEMIRWRILRIGASHQMLRFIPLGEGIRVGARKTLKRHFDLCPCKFLAKSQFLGQEIHVGQLIQYLFSPSH